MKYSTIFKLNLALLFGVVAAPILRDSFSLFLSLVVVNALLLIGLDISKEAETRTAIIMKEE